jgi:Apea-like HEPN
MRHPSDDFASEVEAPCLYTFTAHLPFPLGMPDDLGHTMALGEPFADPDDAAIFGPQVTVNIRVFTFETLGLPLWPVGTHEALRRFYDYELDREPASRFGEDTLTAHDQWVTLETPCAPTAADLDRDDPAFAFHRCLFAFNGFLRGVQAATRDVRIRPIASHDLRPVVVVGALLPGLRWTFLTALLMHPESRPDPLPPEGGPITEEQVNAGLNAVITQQPYLTTSLWRSRAQRALRQNGDAADAIISFQIAAESLLFDTYRMIMVDERLSSAEIQNTLNLDLPFKSLLVKTMPPKLGGHWDVTQTGTAVGDYWEKLYLVRNSVVHAGHEPHGGEAEEAQQGYRRLRDHVEERLLANSTVYPRSVLVRFGREGLETRGFLTRRMRRLMDAFAGEPGPWYWPFDAAGRAQDA